MNILIINQCSTNKGDRAVLYFLLKQLRDSGITDVTVSASNPQYWNESPDFPAGDVPIVPWGWDVSRKKDAGLCEKVLHLLLKVKLPRLICFPLVHNALISGRFNSYLRKFINKEFLEALDRADLVISTGGHHLTTIIAKSIKTPQIFDMAVVLLRNKPLLLWSQSIGSFKFDNPKNRLMIQKILNSAKQIYLRDDNSMNEIKELGVDDRHIFRTYESVFGLYDVVEHRIPPSMRDNTIGISVWTGNKNNPQAWERYINTYVRFIDYAVGKTGCLIKFFPMEMQGADRRCIERIISAVSCKDHCEIVEGFPGTVEHINEVSKCRMFIGHKTHSQIFALVAATPLIAIAYHPKTEDFMSQFGFADYCISDTALSPEKLIEIFDDITENLDVISLRQQDKACKISLQVRNDCAKMLECYSKGYCPAESNCKV